MYGERRRLGGRAAAASRAGTGSAECAEGLGGAAEPREEGAGGAGIRKGQGVGVWDVGLAVGAFFGGHLVAMGGARLVSLQVPCAELLACCVWDLRRAERPAGAEALQLLAARLDGAVEETLKARWGGGDLGALGALGGLGVLWRLVRCQCNGVQTPFESLIWKEGPENGKSETSFGGKCQRHAFNSTWHTHTHIDLGKQCRVKTPRPLRITFRLPTLKCKAFSACSLAARE